MQNYITKILKIMKRMYLLLFILGCFSVVTLYSQTEPIEKNTVTVYIAPGYDFDNYLSFGFGIDYSRKLTEHWSLSGGFERLAIINSSKSIISKEQVGDEVIYSVTDKKGLYFDWRMTSIPVQLKYHFRKTIYIHFGPSLDLLTDEILGTKVGLGWRAGVGFEHEFSNGITLSLNPYFKADFGNTYTEYYQLVVNLGVGYRF